MYRLSLKAQDELLLCTDGLHDMIPDDKLAVILNANATAEGACRNLVEAANTAGGNDNITVIVAKLLAPQVDRPAAFVEAEVPLEQLTMKKLDDVSAAETTVNLPKVGR